jgi:HD-GYP domain-containing protein (c-di-GMP phosphodiesterase class II)
MGNGRLVLLTGPNAGRIYEIDGPVTIGRNPGNPIQIDDRMVSGKHAVVECDADGVLLRDLTSHNGTFVAGRRVALQRLAHGDLIRVGHQELRFETGFGNWQAGGDEPTTTWRGVRFEDKVEGAFQATNAETLSHTLFAPPNAGATVAQLKKVQGRLEAIYKANEIIAAERNLEGVFERIMEQIFKLLPAQNGVILLKEEDKDEWKQAHVKTAIEQHAFTVSRTIVNRAFARKEAIHTSNAASDTVFDAGASIANLNISSALCAPLLYKGTPLGVVYVDTRGGASVFQQGDLELLAALAGQAAIAIKNAQHLTDVEQTYHDTLILMADAVELRDHYTVGHTWRVTNIATTMARQLGWSDEKLAEVEQGAVLHDIGKIAVDNSILAKLGGLTAEEFAKIKVHPQRGADLLKDVRRLKPLVPYCLFHHERYDGGGYPSGLTGENIPIEGRLLAVADTFDAMTSNRPYRRGLAPEAAIVEMETFSGTQLDPACVAALVACFRAGKINHVLQRSARKDDEAISCPYCSTFLRVPERVDAGGEINCHVCLHAVRLRMESGAWFGELVPPMDLTRPPRGKARTGAAG